MSAIEPCLKPKEMASTSVEFLDSYETVDEEKDSDEESFHLFLEGDDDLNKSDDKIQLSDANKNDEEKEKVIEPSNNEENYNLENTISRIPTQESEAVEGDETTNLNEDPNEKENDANTPVNNNIDEENSELNTEDEEKEIQNASPTEELLPTQLNVVNELSKMETADEKKEETTPIQESETKSTETPVETEDDILNKHMTASVTETDIDDVDPLLEDSLLDEKDEIVEDKTLTPKKTDVDSEQIHNLSESVPDNEKMIIDNEICAGPEQNQVTNGEKQSESTETDSSAPEKCGNNSNVRSNISPTFETEEDLLDISMIKDSAQDDADIASDALALEQENEDSDGNSGGNSKSIERLESVDDSSNVDNSDEDGKDSCSGKETTESATDNSQDPEKYNDMLDCTSDDKLQNTDLNADVELDKNGETHIEDENSETAVSKMVCEEIPKTDNNAKKRTLSKDAIESDTKKRKIVEEKAIDSVKDDNVDSWDFSELQSLISFSKFMTKTQMKQLTRTDLEEFCIQKLCEAILHKSELGETNHQLKLHEQTIENLRKEQAVLAKQIKDLETVNKKLMHEVKSHLGVKPLAPVKITRSVGLQVRITQPNDNTAVKRRSSSGLISKTPNNIQTPTPNNRSPRIAQTNPINKQSVQNSPQKTSTPMLNQVLQHRNRSIVKPAPQNNIAVRTTPKLKPTPEKRVKPTGSFIDLTDEDDKKINAKNQTPVKAVVPQGVRINSVPKTISSVLPSVVPPNTTQLMYVVQANSQIKQGLLTTAAGQQKAVLLNFQPQNGVINSLNNSSVSVIPNATSVTAQLKPTSIVKRPKHPAPLPNPPSVQGPMDKTLKAIPPKPVLSIRKTNTGIILQWRMPYDLGLYEGIASYQLYAYQETTLPPNTNMWRKVGDVKAMALPMACTLTQFADKNKYYFAVRPVDIHERIGKFSNPEAISL